MKYFCTECKAYIERDDKKCCIECGEDLGEGSIEPSSEIAGYKIIKEAGRGANGIVYLAEQTSLDRKVALKILPDVKAADPEFVVGFLKEARAAARLNHPSIIQVYDAGITNDGIYFLAMELIDGKSLEDIIQTKGKIKPRKALKIALELAKALEYSWNKEHMFHGDIKPDNIMISPDGRAKLADFGLARTISEEIGGEIMATPMYAPPEVIRAEYNKIGFKSDMYSFGVTLYEILCGTPPFDETDCEKVLNMHLNKKHVPLIAKNPEIDKSLSDLIDKLLSKNPKQRPQSWSNVVASLKALIAQKADAKKRRRLIVSGVSFALLTIILVILGFLRNGGSKVEKQNSSKIVKKLVFIEKKEKESKSESKVEEGNASEIKKDRDRLNGLLLKTKDFSGTILAASNLRFQALKLSEIKNFSIEEKTKLAACIDGLNSYILKAHKDADKRELEQLSIKLEEEKNKTQRKADKERVENLLAAGKNKIYILISEFVDSSKSEPTVIKLDYLLKKNHDLDKNLPEYKTLLFLRKVLPRKYNREAIIFENLDQLEGRKLPWKIKQREYIITGGSWQTMTLQAKLSEGVFSRKKISASSLSDSQWCSLVDEFLVKGKVECTRKSIRNTASWLLLNADDKLFEDFIKKYSSDDSQSWLAARKLLDSIAIEIAAYNEWQKLTKHMESLDKSVYKDIDDFNRKYKNTEIYKSVENTLSEYMQVINRIYPKAIIDRMRIKNLSLKSSSAEIFSAQSRYRYLECISSELRMHLRNIYIKKLNFLAGNEKFLSKFGIFSDIDCGKVYSGFVSKGRGAKAYSAIYIPALMDIDNWHYIKGAFNNESEIKKNLNELEKDSKEYPFILYCNGLAALRRCSWGVLDMVFENYSKLIKSKKVDYIIYALFADLALKTRGDQYAWDVLEKYKFSENIDSGEVIIPLLKIQALLTQNPLDEINISAFIKNTEARFFKKTELFNDLRSLEMLRRLICADLDSQIEIKEDFFKKTLYPNLHARLWLEAAARDKMMQRNAVEIPALLKACRAVLNDSAFRSELFRKISFLELTYRSLTPDQLRDELNKKLLELKPCATSTYPTFLMLSFACELLNSKMTSDKLAPFGRDYVEKCAIFSPVELCFPDILSTSSVESVMERCQNFSPIAFQEVYLWILASSKEKHLGSSDKYIKKLNFLNKDLRWTEQLMVKRMLQLLEN